MVRRVSSRPSLELLASATMSTRDGWLQFGRVRDLPWIFLGAGGEDGRMWSLRIGTIQIHAHLMGSRGRPGGWRRAQLQVLRWGATAPDGSIDAVRTSSFAAAFGRAD